jgi:hypothetical protein
MLSLASDELEPAQVQAYIKARLSPDGPMDLATISTNLKQRHSRYADERTLYVDAKALVDVDNRPDLALFAKVKEKAREDGKNVCLLADTDVDGVRNTFLRGQAQDRTVSVVATDDLRGQNMPMYIARGDHAAAVKGLSATTTWSPQWYTDSRTRR